MATWADLRELGGQQVIGVTCKPEHWHCICGSRAGFFAEESSYALLLFCDACGRDGNKRLCSTNPRDVDEMRRLYEQVWAEWGWDVAISHLADKYGSESVAAWLEGRKDH